MPGKGQPLVNNQKIVNDEGFPTEYFIRWAQTRQIDIADGITLGEAQQLIDDFAAGRDIIAGTGLSGGGNLSSDVTINSEGVTVQQEGVDVATGVFTINFTGVTVTETSPGTVDVDITGGGPPPVGSSHRYWRIKCTSAQGFYGFSEVQMRGTLGGEDIAPGGTPISSSNYSGAFLPAYAFNGDRTNFWAASGGTGQWIGIDFGVATTVAELAFCNLNAGNNPANWDVEWSDDNITWTLAWSGALGTDSTTKFWVTSATSTAVSYPFTTVKYRFIATALPSGGYTSFAEARLLNVNGFPMFPGGTSQSSNFGGYPGANAFDFNVVSNWISSSPSPGEWISFDSSRETILAAGGSFLGIASNVGGEGSRAPTSFNVESSVDNGVSWQLVKAFVAIGAWADGQSRTLAL